MTTITLEKFNQITTSLVDMAKESPPPENSIGSMATAIKPLTAWQLIKVAETVEQLILKSPAYDKDRHRINRNFLRSLQKLANNRLPENDPFLDSMIVTAINHRPHNTIVPFIIKSKARYDNMFESDTWASTALLLWDLDVPYYGRNETLRRLYVSEQRAVVDVVIRELFPKDLPDRELLLSCVNHLGEVPKPFEFLAHALGYTAQLPPYLLQLEDELKQKRIIR